MNSMMRSEVWSVSGAYIGCILVDNFLNILNLDSSTYEVTAAVQVPNVASAVGKCLKELTSTVDKMMFGAVLSPVLIAT